MMDAVRHRHAEVVAFLKRTGAVFDPDVAKGASVTMVVSSPAPARNKGMRSVLSPGSKHLDGAWQPDH